MSSVLTYQLRLETEGSVDQRTLEAASNLDAIRAASAVLATRSQGTIAKLTAPDGLIIWLDVVD